MLRLVSFWDLIHIFRQALLCLSCRRLPLSHSPAKVNLESIKVDQSGDHEIRQGKNINYNIVLMIVQGSVMPKSVV